jgi:hypothetical protein
MRAGSTPPERASRSCTTSFLRFVAAECPAPRRPAWLLRPPRSPPAGKTTALLTSPVSLRARVATRRARLHGGSAPASPTISARPSRDPSNVGAALSVQLPPELQPPEWPHAEPGARLNASLHAWAKVSHGPASSFSMKSTPPDNVLSRSCARSATAIELAGGVLVARADRRARRSRLQSRRRAARSPGTSSVNIKSSRSRCVISPTPRC